MNILNQLERSLAPRALHYWAVLTVLATVCLLALGAIVTTFHVGMADPVWPTYPWHLLLISYDEPKPGFVIEHTHRLAGYVVGCCAIVLAVWLTVSARRSWLMGLGWAVLLCVILQGLLGGFRVRLNALVGTDLAAVHGVFAQIVFSLMVSVALLTSPVYARRTTVDGSDWKRLRHLSLLLTACVLLQLVWGSWMRHTFHPLAQRLHFLTAFAVVAAIVWFVKTVVETPGAWSRLGWPAVLLMVFVTFQLLLGVEAWLGRFGSGQLPDAQLVTPHAAAIRTAHVLLGSWLLALSVSCTLLTSRVREASAAREVVASRSSAVPQLEGSV